MAVVTMRLEVEGKSLSLAGMKRQRNVVWERKEKKKREINPGSSHVTTRRFRNREKRN